MTKQIQFIVFICFGLCIGLEAQQQLLPSQNWWLRAYQNIAYAGTESRNNFQMLFRKQWMLTGNSPTLVLARIEAKTKTGAWDVCLHQTQSPLLQQQTIKLGYAFTFKFSEQEVLHLGVRAGMFNCYVKQSALSAKDPTELNEWLVQQRVSLFTYDFGAMYQRKKFIAALSASSLNKYGFTMYQTQGGLSFLPIYCLQLSNRFEVGTIGVRPILTAYSTQGMPALLDVSVLIESKHMLDLQVGCRSNRQAYGNLQVKIAEQFKAAYACDFSFLLQKYTGIGNELSLTYLFNK